MDKLTQQQGIDLFWEDSIEIDGQTAKQIALQGDDKHRWYVSKMLIFSYQDKLYSINICIPNNEEGEFVDVNPDEFEPIEVEATQKTITFYKEKQ